MTDTQDTQEKEQLLMVTREQALTLAAFCISIKMGPGEALIAVILNQIGDDFSPEKIGALKEWAHGIIDSIDCAQSSYVH